MSACSYALGHSELHIGGHCSEEVLDCPPLLTPVSSVRAQAGNHNVSSEGSGGHASEPSHRFEQRIQQLESDMTLVIVFYNLQTVSMAELLCHSVWCVAQVQNMLLLHSERLEQVGGLDA